MIATITNLTELFEEKEVARAGHGTMMGMKVIIAIRTIVEAPLKLNNEKTVRNTHRTNGRGETRDQEIEIIIAGGEEVQVDTATTATIDISIDPTGMNLSSNLQLQKSELNNLNQHHRSQGLASLMQLIRRTTTSQL
jgi:hypothetical protein